VIPLKPRDGVAAGPDAILADTVIFTNAWSVPGSNGLQSRNKFGSADPRIGKPAGAGAQERTQVDLDM